MQKLLKTTLLAILLPSSSLVAANSLDFASLVEDFMNKENALKKIINLSGKQRMLTQNMSKLTLLIQLNVKKEMSIEELTKLSKLYNTTLMAFKNGNTDMGIPKATNKKVIEQVLVVEEEWKVFYGHIENIIKEKDDGSSLQFIMKNNLNLLKISNELVKRYELSITSDNYLEKVRLRVINVAGKQRMLTQKMTKEKLLVVKGDKGSSSDLVKTVKLFDDSLTDLIKGNVEKHLIKATNPKITAQLKVVTELWSQLKPLYIKEKNDAKELAVIVSKNTVLLKEMNAMVKLAEVEVEY